MFPEGRQTMCWPKMAKQEILFLAMLSEDRQNRKEGNIVS
jgi:hypothetical protein